MRKILLGLGILPCLVFAQSDDNEIWIEQSGDTFKLYVDQVGFGNKIGGNDFSSSASDMVISGTTLEFDLDFTGDQNVLFGPVTADSSTYNLNFTGDSNQIDWSIGVTGSADTSTYDFTVTGDSNTFDIDQGAVASAERLDADLTIIGSSNAFDLDWESDDATWDFEITGGSNNINTLQKDGGDHTITVDLNGDSADVDITQISGTCVTGAPAACSTPSGYIDLDITSDNSIIQITQKDSSNDS